MRWAWRGINGVVTSIFLLFAVVQYNDPDPVRWMAIYLAAALCCALELTGRLRWPLPVLTTVAALIWAGIWAPRVVGQVNWDTPSPATACPATSRRRRRGRRAAW